MVKSVKLIQELKTRNVLIDVGIRRHSIQNANNTNPLNPLSMFNHLSKEHVLWKLQNFGTNNQKKHVAVSVIRNQIFGTVQSKFTP